MDTNRVLELRCWCPLPLTILNNTFYSAPVGERSIAISLSVCLSVCPLAYLWNCWTDLHEFFADPLWPWLCPTLAALRYVMNFWFYGWRHVCNAMRIQGSGVSLYAPSKWQRRILIQWNLCNSLNSCFRFLKFLLDNYVPFLGLAVVGRMAMRGRMNL